MEIQRPSEPNDLEKQLQFQRSFGASTGTTPTSLGTPIDAHTRALMAQDLSDDDDDDDNGGVLAPPDDETTARNAIRDDDDDDDNDFMSQVQKQMTFATEAPGRPPDALSPDTTPTPPETGITPREDTPTQPSSENTLLAAPSVAATLPLDDEQSSDRETTTALCEFAAEESSSPVDDAFEPLPPPPIASKSINVDAPLVLAASQSIDILPPINPNASLARQPTSLPDLHTWPSDLLAMKPISPALLPYVHGFEPSPARTDLVSKHKPLHPKPPPPKKWPSRRKRRATVKAWLERKKAEQAKLRALQAAHDPNEIQAEKARRRAEAQHQFELWRHEKAKLTHKLAKEKKAAEHARLEDRRVLHATHAAEIKEVQLKTQERLATIQHEKHQQQRHRRRKVAKLVQQRQSREYDDMLDRLEKIQSVLTRVTQKP
ncbi:hypothetical protein SPRG_11744 [Saprolegnia parasitica CBS 223.65]|uniref:Uncharacterized protein n=1 Tax=Saprolegnia parasitica (strain CBS 223.65) TaxID=695850 RepID=A0A067C1A4_SAPPC|nr:hypothetical protein SPRG_11744 [Saprolegnia parasitica CBS 223.65]KDO22900.1 hypothetical protein SPRG_11744 [Saprolegnia parasitica CBS 223.65]|eukprot:XP_012206340.1 hypothetical protein SPRG_11744 [Saprolegnia parasitica CBS 223.65]